MRNSFLIVTFLLILTGNSLFCQVLTKEIGEIRREFKLINSDSTYKKVELDNDYFIERGRITDGGCSLTGYVKSGSIRKIISWVGLSSGNEIIEFYYKNNKLIFVYEEFHSFVYDKSSGEFRQDTTEKTFIGRYYFKEDKLNDYITTGHNRFEDDTVDPERTLLAESGSNMQAILRKMKNIR
jgi:hypothetical protein